MLFGLVLCYYIVMDKQRVRNALLTFAAVFLFVLTILGYLVLLAILSEVSILLMFLGIAFGVAVFITIITALM